MLITGRSKCKGFFLSVSSVPHGKQGQSKSKFVLSSDWMKTCITCARPLNIFYAKQQRFYNITGDGWGAAESNKKLECRVHELKSAILRMYSRKKDTKV